MGQGVLSRAMMSAVDLDLPPPPRERRWEALRRWWRSQRAHVGLRFWFFYRGAPLLAFYLALFLISGFVLGWREAYDVNRGIASPASTRQPALAWLLSLAGWLFMPSIIGAIAGYVVSSSIVSRRRTPFSHAFQETEDDD
jgi:hypothetical protein